MKGKEFRLETPAKSPKDVTEYEQPCTVFTLHHGMKGILFHALTRGLKYYKTDP